MIQTDFPINEAKPLIKMPLNLPVIGFLGGEAGKEINDSIQKDYKDFSVLQVGDYDKKERIIRGSNPFYVVAVQSKIPKDLRVASQSDLERAMKLGVMDFEGTYEDTALVLRTEKNPNSYLASNLMKQVKARNPKQRMPVIIPLSGLALEKDQGSFYGFSFKLGENAEIIYTPILNKDSENFSSLDINEKTGLTKKLGRGDRCLVNGNLSLSRFGLSPNLNIGAFNQFLFSSESNGRIVLVHYPNSTNVEDKD